MRPLKNLCEVAVIGGGLAGLAAARHAARLGRLVTLFEITGMYGGLVATVDHVDGLPVPGKFTGQDLAINLLEDARKNGVRIFDTGIANIDLGKRLTLTDNENRIHNPEAIIVASGASLRRLGVPGEEEFSGRGVSRCATCDGGFFRGQDVVVVGGGDAAVCEALVLAKTSRKVIMVSRSPLKAKREYADKIAARENIDFVWDSEVSAVIGDGSGVTGARVRNVKDGTSSDIACMGLFAFIGGVPNSQFVPPSLLNASGHIKTISGFATADSRVLAAGAVRADYGGNIVEAMAEGVSAAEAAARALSH
ncbi:MAG: TrxB [Hydrocarboniphaga sp.]|uniref:NAD(P)/FAD-dependent oxidoreductase n=1 Tax=Hydrocarboniphaga sp. TaxID=2033016 RepID=UPI00262CE116|nr:FAD-dependent oxidoreductase [Hydrocarboniphaga sp.]MDB5970382.1 TrxB [Hydrocarboniphaga sp.]